MCWVFFYFFLLSLGTALPMSYAIWILIHTQLLSKCVPVWNFNRIETKCVEFGQSTIYFSAFRIQLLKTAIAPNASNTSQRVGTNFVLSSDTIIFMQPSTCVPYTHWDPLIVQNKPTVENESHKSVGLDMFKRLLQFYFSGYWLAVLYFLLQTFLYIFLSCETDHVDCLHQPQSNSTIKDHNLTSLLLRS